MRPLDNNLWEQRQEISTSCLIFDGFLGNSDSKESKMIGTGIHPYSYLFLIPLLIFARELASSLRAWAGNEH